MGPSEHERSDSWDDLTISRRRLLQGCAAAALGASAVAAAAEPLVNYLDTHQRFSTGGVKYILLARKKQGLSLEEFKSYYEGHHSKLLLTLKRAPVTRYYRRYLHPQTHLDPGSAGESDDVMSEIWSDTAADMDAIMGRFDDPTVGEMFSEDETNLFDRPSMKTYRVHEYETDLTSLSTAAAAWRKSPTDDVVKSILIAHRRPGMSMSEFQDYYEHHHSKVVNDLSNPPLVRYFRRYLHPESQWDPQPGGNPPSVVMEMWYRTRADMDLVDQSFYASPKVKLYIQDEARLFDRASMKYYVAEEYDSDLRPLSS
jgi:EthD domain